MDYNDFVAYSKHLQRDFGWVFLEWGHQNQHRTANVGPSKRNMICHIFRVEGKNFLNSSIKMPNHPSKCAFQIIFQGATKGGRQKEFDHFSVFGQFLVTFSDVFVTLFVTLLPDSFCWTPVAAG